MYKRYYMWCMRVYSHIPGLRWYGRTVLASIEKRGFWRTWWLNYVASLVVTFLSYKATAWAINVLVEEERLTRIEEMHLENAARVAARDAVRTAP